MASELDDTEGDRKRLRVAPDVAKDAERPSAKGEVTAEVERVVNLLQRLEKLHSKKAPLAEASPATRPLGGLSSLGDRSGGRGGLRAVPTQSVAFNPPPIPPVRASTDLPSVLRGPLPVGGSGIDPQSPLGLGSSGEDRASAETAKRSEQALPAPVREKRDDPPVVMIASVVIGLVVFAGLGMYQFQRAVPVGQRELSVVDGSPASPAPRATRADSTAALVPGNAAAPSAVACDAALTGNDRGVLSLVLTDAARAGQATAISVDDFRYGATFDAKGALRFEAPFLSAQPVVRWDQPNGPPCQKSVVMPKGAGLLRVALVWTGDTALELHVIEPNAWFGGPNGHISSLKRNTGQSNGVGLMQAFGDGTKGMAKVDVYSVETSRIAPGGILNAFVKPAASSSRSATCREGTAPGEELPVQYQVMILKSPAQSGELQAETRSFVMGIDPCGRSGGGDDRGERIIVRN